ncbi:MAG: hypothetical protein H7841_13370 [Magnetospirillum sp. WYHS-4]
MILEWLRHRLTPCPRHLREMGYLREIVAIDSRWRRHRAAWTMHLAECKALVREAADACPHHRKATVYGSGLLLDLPLAELAKRFGEVVLVDILHLPAVKRAARAYPNVRLVEADVTGLVAEVYAGGLPAPELAALPEGDGDLAVSLNILTQLSLIPSWWAERRHPPDKVEAFRRAVIEHHLALLRACPGTVCLIAEAEELYCDGDNILDRDDALHGAHLPEGGREWTWDIAPRPELTPDYDFRLRVRGVILKG